MGVDDSFFDPPDGPNGIRAKFNIPPEKKILLTVSRLDERKGHRVVLQSLASLPADVRSSVAYVMTGEAQNPGYLEELRELASGIDVPVVFTGLVSENELRSLYANAYLFCMPGEPNPGKVEGFGLAYLEAAAQGLPAVASSIGAIPEVVVHDQTGLLVEPMNIHCVRQSSDRPSIKSHSNRTAWTERQKACGDIHLGKLRPSQLRVIVDMKVLLVNSLYYPNIVGGAERSTQILAEGLAAAGVRTAVVCTSDRNATDTVNGITVHYLKVPNLYWVKNARSAPALLKPIWHTIDTDNPFTPSRLVRVLELEKPDIVHTANLSGFSPAVWKASRGADVPIVHTIRDMYLGCVRSAMFRNGKGCVTQCLSCKLYSIARKRLSGLVNGVVGVSEYVLKWHLDHGYFERAAVKQCIYNPIVTNGSGPSDRRKDGRLTFGFVGEISPHKGVELLLSAFRSLKYENARLKIYGKPFDVEYGRRLRDKYNDPRIEFAGFAEPKAIFASIDLNVLPSLCHEAFPRAVVEGYSYGVPAIVSSRGGIPEAIVENETGTVFDPGRPGDLSERMMRFLDHPELVGQMQSNCLERAQNYATEKIVGQYIDVYEKILK